MELKLVTATTEKLTLEILKNIDFNDVIYGERTQEGAMGNAGGVIITLINKSHKFIKYETNLFKDEVVALAALKQIAINNHFFNRYPLNVGNGAYIKRNITLEILDNEECFLYRRGPFIYKIDCSVYGVFRDLSKSLRGDPNIGDPMHAGWEDSFKYMKGFLLGEPFF
jgi:hypothetical protein